MGLLREGINEVIATTRGNAAPMGIIVREGKLTMVVFRESHTAARLSSDGWVVANFLFDPVVYVKTAFDDRLPATSRERKQGGSPLNGSPLPRRGQVSGPKLNGRPARL